LLSKIAMLSARVYKVDITKQFTFKKKKYLCNTTDKLTDGQKGVGKNTARHL